VKGRWRSVGEVLGAVMSDRGLAEGLRRHTALLGWDEIVGRRIGEKARPRELRGKTLFVDVDGSAWIHELSFLKADILEKLNERVGGDAIDRIVFLAKGSEEDGRENAIGREKRDGRGK
jgi:predicted nucleic acid-binding Zn ribbon protein